MYLVEFFFHDDKETSHEHIIIFHSFAQILQQGFRLCCHRMKPTWSNS